MLAENAPVANERTPTTPPIIQPVPEHIPRPLWSVMIPAFNCYEYLHETLTSVLAQDPGPEHMQIMIVDDYSTDGDIALLIETIGKGRIEYFRQKKNVGSLRNFETCLNLARGKQIHLLHGDDRVQKGFYAEIEMLFRDYPEAGAAFTNVAFVTNDMVKIDEPICQNSGIIKDFLIQIAESQKLQPPAIVVKRYVYEQLGGFYGVHYGEDWEMWTRIAAHFPVAYSPKCLAHYRYLNFNSITHYYIKSGQNVRDIIKVINNIQHYLPLNQRQRLKKAALRNYSLYCISLAHQLYPKDTQAALVQVQGALRMSNSRDVISAALRFYATDHLYYKQLKYLWKND